MNVALLAAVKRSAQYRSIRSRVARACPSDTWYEGRAAFVVFDLVPAMHESLDPSVAQEAVPAVAVFAVSSVTQELIAARVVEGTDDGAVTDLMSEKGETVL